jgi:hypothetical protein
MGRGQHKGSTKTTVQHQQAYRRRQGPSRKGLLAMPVQIDSMVVFSGAAMNTYPCQRLKQKKVSVNAALFRGKYSRLSKVNLFCFS